MNTYVALFEHNPELCPASTMENMERTGGQMAQIESLSKELNVTLDAIHVLLPGHKGVAILQANDYETAGDFLLKLGIQDWNQLTLYRSYTPQESMGAARERMSAA